MFLKLVVEPLTICSLHQYYKHFIYFVSSQKISLVRSREASCYPDSITVTRCYTNHPKKTIAKLQRIQNSLVKIIYELPWKTSTGPYMKELHWLPVRERITYKIGVMTYKCKYNLAPSYLSVLIKNCAPTRQLRSTSANLLVEPVGVISEAASKAFSVAGPAVWNRFDEAVRNASTLPGFKTKLKTSLFKVAYNMIWTFYRLFHLTAFISKFCRI